MIKPYKLAATQSSAVVTFIYFISFILLIIFWSALTTNTHATSYVTGSYSADTYNESTYNNQIGEINNSQTTNNVEITSNDDNNNSATIELNKQITNENNESTPATKSSQIVDIVIRIIASTLIIISLAILFFRYFYHKNDKTNKIKL